MDDPTQPVDDPTQPTAAIELDADLGLLRVEIRGTYRLEAWVKLIQTVSNTDGYEPGMDALYVATDALFDFSQDDVQVLTAWVKERIGFWGEGWRYATVVSSDLMFGMSRMVASWFDDAPFEAKVFRSEEEARAWIDEGRGRG